MEKVRKSWKMYLVNPRVNILLKARLVIGLLEKYLPMFNIFSFKYFQINSFWHVVIWVNYQQDLTVVKIIWVRIFGSAVFLQKSEQWHSQLKQILKLYFFMENYKKDHTFYDIFLVPFAYFQQDHRLRAFKPKFAHSVCALTLKFTHLCI